MKNHKMGIFIFAIAVLWFIATEVRSKEYHHGIIITEQEPANYQLPADTYQTGSKGVASAISAAQCHFDGGSFDLQLCGGYGNSFGQDAYTFGAGQKVGDFLLNFTETTENGKSSHGFGINWKVKIK